MKITNLIIGAILILIVFVNSNSIGFKILCLSIYIIGIIISLIKKKKAHNTVYKK